MSFHVISNLGLWSVVKRWNLPVFNCDKRKFPVFSCEKTKSHVPSSEQTKCNVFSFEIMKFNVFSKLGLWSVAKRRNLMSPVERRDTSCLQWWEDDRNFLELWKDKIACIQFWKDEISCLQLWTMKFNAIICDDKMSCPVHCEIFVKRRHFLSFSCGKTTSHVSSC